LHTTATLLRGLSLGTGLAIKGNDALMAQWTATFSTFLSEALAGKGYAFELVPLDIPTTYTAVERREVDFVYTNPSVFSCLESEFGARAIISQNNLRMGNELYYWGGSLITRSSRDDITKPEHVKGKVVEAVSISETTSCQMQIRELQSRGVDVLIDSKEVRFAYNQKKIVKDGACVRACC
jgi:hypothetical protein